MSFAGGGTEDIRNTPNEFRRRTGQPTWGLMVMMAKNRPDEFDEAGSDRVDNFVSFSLPGATEGRDILILTIIATGKRSCQHSDEHSNSSRDKVATQTEVFSELDMEKLVVVWRCTGYANIYAALRVEESREVLPDHVQQRKRTQGWAGS